MSALMILKFPNVTVLDDEVYICSSSRKVTALSSKTTPPIKQKIKRDKMNEKIDNNYSIRLLKDYIFLNPHLLLPYAKHRHPFPLAKGANFHKTARVK